MKKLTKAQKAEKISQAKSILINATKSLGFAMLPPNETFDVSIKDGVTLESIEESAITTDSGVHKFVPVICIAASDNKEYESSLYCGVTDKTPEPLCTGAFCVHIYVQTSHIGAPCTYIFFVLLMQRR